MEVAFWILLAIVVYTYVGFALITGLWIFLREMIFGKRNIPKAGEFILPVTLVIPAWNEIDDIDAKVENSLALNYPSGQLKIMFITDGSTDGTDEAVRKYVGTVELLHSPERGGKSAAENRAMAHVDTPIVVMCDANTMLNPDAITQIVRHYSDPKVGGVSGEKRVISRDGTKEKEGLYWKYESALKRLDARLYSIVGAAGELVSFRTELWSDLEHDTILDDFMASLRICSEGYRFAYEPSATASEYPSANVVEELKRKVRIAAGGWQSMWRLPQLWKFWKHPRLTFSYVSHRVMRWSISAFALPLLFLSNVALLGSGVQYGVLLMAQIAFYLMALLGWWGEKGGPKLPFTGVAYYFVVMNYAVYAGFLRWLKGSQKAQWERSKRG